MKILNGTINKSQEIYKRDLPEHDGFESKVPRLNGSQDRYIGCLGDCPEVCFCKAGECGCKGCMGNNQNKLKSA